MDPIEINSSASVDGLQTVVLPTTSSQDEFQIKRIRVWGVEFAKLDMMRTLEFVRYLVQRGKPEFLITANLNYLMLTQENPQLEKVNQRAAAILADGHPIVWRSRLGSCVQRFRAMFGARKAATSGLQSRVAGSDLILELGRLSAEHGYRVFLLGGEPGVAEAAADVMQTKYPGCQIAGCYAPPFRKLSEQEELDMLARISDTKADILLLATGQPRGEIWLSENLDKIAASVSIQVGASFDFLAGKSRRAPKFFQRIGCEWLYRACSEPRRLVPRYARNAAFLLKCVIRESFSKQ
ncbi:MAG: WecB/TagA/CpsF family glycosyltransferase [Planctomycetota bacterium]